MSLRQLRTMSIVRHYDPQPQRERLIRRSTTAELAEVAWSEGLKFCRLKYFGDHYCTEPCDECYQTALNFLIADAQRMRRHEG